MSKDIEQLRAEMQAKLGEWLRGNGMNLAHYDSAARFDSWCTEDVPIMVVALLTEGWSADKKLLDLDKDKILRDPAAPLVYADDDYDEKQATKVVVYEIETPYRPLTDTERAELAEKKAKSDAYWAKERAISDWKRNGLDVPPPDGIGIDDLLDQVVWWVTKDKRALRIGEMTPSHRANLLKLMRRQAEAWKNAEFNRFLGQGAPDEVWMSAENTPAQEWLNDKRLFQALRHLVIADQIGEEACAVEWSDEKPVGCLPGTEGHVCVLQAGHKKRCSCRCGARPAKDSAAAEAARKQRRELASDEITAEQRAMVAQLFPGHTSPTGKTVNEETVQRFMDLSATRRMGLDPETDDSMQIVHSPIRSTAPAEEDIH